MVYLNFCFHELIYTGNRYLRTLNEWKRLYVFYKYRVLGKSAQIGPEQLGTKTHSDLNQYGTDPWEDFLSHSFLYWLIIIHDTCLYL